MTEITGDNKDNLIDGTDAGEIISSGNGADTVNAGGGDDTVYAGNGDDTVDGGDGDDTVYAGNGDDTVDGGDGDDTVYAGNGDDTVDGGSGDDTVYAGNGDDTVNGGSGDDTAYLGNGDDTVIHVEFDNIGFSDVYYGQNGRDTLYLVLLQPTYESALFQQELAAFQSMIASQGSASGTFTSLGIRFESFENIEVVIDPNNYAPTAITLDNASVDENNAGASVGNLAATDPNGDTVFTYAVDDTRFEVVNGQLKLIDGVSLDHEAAATLTVNVTVADAGGLTFTQAFDVTVNDVNEAPTAINLDNASVDENAAGAIVGNLTTTDPDSDTAFTYAVDDVRFEVVSGQLKLVDDVSLDHETEPSVTVNVTTTDAGGLTFTQAFDVTVNDVNEAPTVEPATELVGANESVGIDLLEYADDVDGDALSVASFGQGANGSVAFDPVSGEWIYTPDADFVGSDSFTYEVSDGALTTTGTIDVEVLPVRTADETAAVIAGTATAERIVGNSIANTINSGLGADVVSGGGGLDTFVGTSAELNGDVILDLEPGESIVITDVTLTKDDITFSAGSIELSYAGSTGAIVGITIDNGVIGNVGDYIVTTPPSGIGTVITNSPTGTNSAPVGTTFAIELDEDSPLTGTLLAVDPNGDPVQFASAGDPEHGTLVVDTDGGFTYAPDADFNGIDYFAYAVGDGTYATVRVVTVTVNPVNDPPVAVDDSATTNEDTPVNIDVLANDTDDESSVLLLTGATADHGAVALAGDGTITYTPDPDFNGTDTITYTVSDDLVGIGLTATGTATVTVNPVNDDPVAVDDAAATRESLSVNIDVLGNDTDVDGDTLSTLSASAGANGATGVNPNGTVTYTPDPGFTGTDSFTYTTSDGNGGTDTATVTVTVAPNNSPIAVDDSASIAEDGGIVTIDVRANDSDPDGDTILVTSASTPAHGIAVAQPGNVVYQPDPDFNGTDSFTYTITDQFGATDTATVTVTVTPVNDAPVAVDDAVTTNEDVIVSIDVLANDTDIDGDTLSIVSVNPGTKGAVFNPGDGTLTYLPDANANGTDTFTYTISDQFGATDTATVTVTLNPVNDAPVAHDDTALTGEDTPVVVDVLANDFDVDGDVLNITAGGATGGTINIEPDNTVTFTPDPGFNGIATFGYTVFDGDFAADSGAVTVYVAAEETGTPGDDTFIFNMGDGLLRVIDFNASGSDQIDLSGFAGLTFASLDTNTDGILDANDSDVSGGSGGDPIMVDLAGGDILFVEGVVSLTQGDLLFA